MVGSFLINDPLLVLGESDTAPSHGGPPCDAPQKQDLLAGSQPGIPESSDGGNASFSSPRGILLRIASRGRWAADRAAGDSRHVEDAANDLRLKPRESGLSVFRTEDPDNAREVAVRFALTCRVDPRHADYLVFPSELAERLGLAVAHVPRQDLEPRLGERHYEIVGLTPELGLRLAAEILADDGRVVGRVEKADLIHLGTELCRRDPGLKKHLAGRWPALLDDTAAGG